MICLSRTKMVRIYSIISTQMWSVQMEHDVFHLQEIQASNIFCFLKSFKPCQIKWRTLRVGLWTSRSWELVWLDSYHGLREPRRQSSPAFSKLNFNEVITQIKKRFCTIDILEYDLPTHSEAQRIYRCGGDLVSCILMHAPTTRTLFTPHATPIPIDGHCGTRRNTGSLKVSVIQDRK